MYMLISEKEMETKIIGPFSIHVLFITFALISLVFISNVQNTIAAVPISITKTSKTIYKNYLKTACNTTTYPKLCYSSLSPYTSTIKTNDLNLCNAALNITLKVAKNTSALVKSLSKQKGLTKIEISVVKDCLYEIADSIDELKQAFTALKSLNSSSNVEFQIDDIKTWISAAITDQNTCIDGFDEMNVSSSLKRQIKKGIYNFIGLTSNALALVNKLDL